MNTRWAERFRIPLPATLMLIPVLAAPVLKATATESLSAGALTVDTKFREQHLSGIRLHDAKLGKILPLSEAFSLAFKDGSVLKASQLVATQIAPGNVEDPHEAFRVKSDEPNHATKACWNLAAPAKALDLNWCLVARSGTQYVRELLQIRATSVDVPLTEVRLIELKDSDAKVGGTLKSSPIVTRSMFFGFEHPLSTSTVTGGTLRASLFRTLPLKAGQSITYSAVIGIAADGQMRRSFAAYLESERPRRYEPFLHYNSWYDLGYRNRFDEAGVLNRIHAFGEELVAKRHVKIDSFLLDDGWDDTGNLWSFNPGFANGLTASSKAASDYGFGIGLWLSPWGGYGDEKLQRVAYGRAHNFEILNDGYALSGPKYFHHFEQTCIDMISKYNVNQFKFDGTGNADRVFPGSAFDSDFDAAIHLIENLRRKKPDVFINLTTGTTASPFWVFYADSIWRGGEDHDFSGVGSSRQRWITYRDAQTYKNIVGQGPLFPLNSLMLHGVIYAKEAEGLSADPNNDFADEVHSYFGSGTQTQELYITPDLLSKANWDTLGEAARWSREHHDALQDVHWLGGNPDKLQVYGWGAWSPKLGIITLRNPSDHEQTYALDVATAFELNATMPATYKIRPVWGAEALAGTSLSAGNAVSVKLAPFQVVTLEATPQR